LTEHKADGDKQELYVSSACDDVHGHLPVSEVMSAPQNED